MTLSEWVMPAETPPVTTRRWASDSVHEQVMAGLEGNGGHSRVEQAPVALGQVAARRRGQTIELDAVSELQLD